MCGHSKSQANVHAATVAFYRGIEKTFDLGEGHDLVKLRFDLGPGHAENRAIEKDIFATSQFRMETGADFKQASDPAAHNCPAFRRLSDPTQDLQQCRFARPVASDNAEHLTALDLEAHIPQGPEFLDLVALHDLPATEEIERLTRKIMGLAGDDVAQRRISLSLGGLVTNEVAFRKILDGN